MIYITGDCHAEYSRFKTRSFKDQENMTKSDYVIICGDFGYWADTPDQKWWLDWLEATDEELEILEKYVYVLEG